MGPIRSNFYLENGQGTIIKLSSSSGVLMVGAKRRHLSHFLTNSKASYFIMGQKYLWWGIGFIRMSVGLITRRRIAVHDDILSCVDLVFVLWRNGVVYAKLALLLSLNR